MPLTPWNLSGYIYDIDNSTKLSGVSVTVMNVRSGESKSTTSETDGSYSVTFTSYENDDVLVVEAVREISSYYDKVGLNFTTIDTGVAGKTLDVTLDKFVDKSIGTVIHRTPIQQRDERIFDPRFDAIRVLPTGFDKKQTTITRNADNYITSIEENDGIHTKVTTFTRDANNLVTSIAERIK